MTKQDILDEVATSQWQPVFTFTDDLDAVVDSILKPHEDYFLGLHDKVKGIIQRECLFRDSDETRHVAITFADVSNWQKELFMYRHDRINYHYDNSDYATICPDDLTEEEEDLWYENQSKHTDIYKQSKGLPNLFINLGLRDTNIQTGKWTPPAPMFLEDLKEMCFPLKIADNEFLTLPNYYDDGLIKDSKVDDDYFKYWITEWYKTFKLCYFFEDFNEELSNIVINILSYILTGKYLIK